MALGKPTIAPRLGPLEEVIDDGVTGILTEPGDARIRPGHPGLATIAKRGSGWGSAAREYVMAHHTWEQNAREIVKIREDLRSE